MLKTVQAFAAISLACQAWLPVAFGQDVALADTINLDKRDEQEDALVSKGSHRQKNTLLVRSTITTSAAFGTVLEASGRSGTLRVSTISQNKRRLVKSPTPNLI
jgi:two-component sensor histidine kinase